MIPKNLPPAIAPVERAREALAATATAPVCIAPAPILICNAPAAASPVASVSIKNSAQLHVRQLNSEIGEKMDGMNEREAQIRDHTHEQRAMAFPSTPSITFGLQEYNAPALARLAGIEHEAEKSRHQQEVLANAQQQLANLATNFFTIKNSMSQQAADVENGHKSFVTGL